MFRVASSIKSVNQLAEIPDISNRDRRSGRHAWGRRENPSPGPQCDSGVMSLVQQSATAIDVAVATTGIALIGFGLVGLLPRPATRRRRQRGELGGRAARPPLRAVGQASYSAAINGTLTELGHAIGAEATLIV